MFSDSFISNRSIKLGDNLIKNCLNCDNFRFFTKTDECIVWCDLMFEYYTVSMEMFTEAFYKGRACEHWMELDELTEQEME